MRVGSQQDELRQPLIQRTTSSSHTDVAIIQERNRDMREIESELSALRDVMRDVKDLVDEGRDQLDIAEQQVVVSDVRVEKGIDDLEESNKLACSARWKKLWILICCLILLAIIAVVVVVVVVVFLKK